MAFTWTDEQVTFLQCEDPIIRIRAFAGAAKTTSLFGYTKARPHTTFLYLAYNKSVRDEAKARFGRNVTCMTIHGLAYSVIGIKFKHKLTASLRLRDVGNIIGSSDWGFIKLVVETLNGFLCASDETINTTHIPKRSYEYAMNQKVSFLENLFKSVETVWAKMCDPEDKEIGMTHDGYLKLFSLASPDLSKYDVILIDECQDSNGVTFHIVMQQKDRCRLIFCGDKHQQLYAFRGASNALDHPSLAESTDLLLTQSFRFGPAVAIVANKILDFKGEKTPVVGSGAPTMIKLELPPEANKPAYIHRTVMGVIDTAIEMACKGKKIYWVGGVDAYSIGDVEDLQRLSKNQVSEVKNKRLLTEYGDIDKYMDMAEETHDPEMRRAVKILQTYSNLSEMLKQVRKMSVKDEADCDVVVSTAHRSKGLEWDYVQMGEDFIDPLDRELDMDLRSDEINILYVTLTRAKLVVAINAIVVAMLREHTMRTKNNLKIQIT